MLFSESDVLTGGDKTSTFMVNDVKVGVGICYDIRFAELAQKYRKLFEIWSSSQHSYLSV